jgi:hypothetical protein
MQRLQLQKPASHSRDKAMLQTEGWTCGLLVPRESASGWLEVMMQRCAALGLSFCKAMDACMR